MWSALVLPRMLRPCASLPPREQRSPFPYHSRSQDHLSLHHPGGQICSLSGHQGYWDPEASQARLLQGQHGKIMQDLEEQVIWEESRCQSDFLSASQAAVHDSPAELKGMLVASDHILLGQAPTSQPFALLQRTSPAEEQSTPAAPPTPVPKQSPRPKRQHLSPDPVESLPLGGTTSKTTSEGPPSSKWWEVPPWNKALKLSHGEAFSWDSDLVKEARKEYFSKHSYNFITEGTHSLSEIFRWIAKSVKLLGTSVYEIKAS